VVVGEGGYVNSPGYPLYYLGENTCGWTFRTLPGQRIVLTFHDLDIRGKHRATLAIPHETHTVGVTWHVGGNSLGINFTFVNKKEINERRAS